MYTCGPTVYNFPHIGNYRTFLFEDILHRYLEFKGYKVYQVMNITDVEDKIIRACKEYKISLKDYTQKYTSAFFEEIDALNIGRAWRYPKATEHIEEMVDLVKILYKKGYAYEKEGSVYFSISKFPAYGRLNGIRLDELKVGARVKADEYAKEDAQDFALWKGWDEGDGENYWETPLGKGRPGWHIECSAMSMKYLGETFDIHTGGVDNKFPHHENEIAQSEAATGRQLARYWLHAEHLLVNGERMGKSLHNFVTLRELMEQGVDPIAVRFFLLSGHYRSQINFTKNALDQARENVNRLRAFEARVSEPPPGKSTNESLSRSTGDMVERFEVAMDNDLLTPEAIRHVFEYVRATNKEVDAGRYSSSNQSEILRSLQRIDSVLGFLTGKPLDITEEQRNLIEVRQEARKRRDWKEADRIRSQLEEMGIILVDTPSGVKWQRKTHKD